MTVSTLLVQNPPGGASASAMLAALQSAGVTHAVSVPDFVQFALHQKLGEAASGIRCLFTAVFYIITELNMREQKNTVKLGRGEVIFEEFMELVRQYSKQERNVRFYARRLNITPKYLSTVSKDVSGKTAARWIDEAVILEAKSLLRYSGMSIQEIAYHLNFSTQSFFGKYFKQHTGYSPSRFKRKGS